MSIQIFVAFSKCLNFIKSSAWNSPRVSFWLDMYPVVSTLTIIAQSSPCPMEGRLNGLCLLTGQKSGQRVHVTMLCSTSKKWFQEFKPTVQCSALWPVWKNIFINTHSQKSSWSPGLPRPIFARQGHHSVGHISSVPPLPPPLSILQNQKIAVFG